MLPFPFFNVVTVKKLIYIPIRAELKPGATTGRPNILKSEPHTLKKFLSNLYSIQLAWIKISKPFSVGLTRHNGWLSVSGEMVRAVVHNRVVVIERSKTVKHPMTVLFKHSMISCQIKRRHHLARNKKMTGLFFYWFFRKLRNMHLYDTDINKKW